MGRGSVSKMESSMEFVTFLDAHFTALMWLAIFALICWVLAKETP